MKTIKLILFQTLVFFLFIPSSFSAKKPIAANIIREPNYFVIFENINYSKRKKNVLLTFSEHTKWLKIYNKVNKRKLIFVTIKGHQLITFPEDAESSFLAKSLSDFNFYTKIFPESNRISAVYKSAIPHLGKSDLLKMLNFAPNINCNYLVAKEYLNKSNTVLECYEASLIFSELRIEAEEKAAQLVSNIQDVRNFHLDFKDSKSTAAMISNVIPKLNRNELLDLINLYPNNETIQIAKIKYIQTGKYFIDIIRGINSYPEFKSFGDEELAKKSYSFKLKKIYLKHYPSGKFSNQFVREIDVEERRKQKAKQKAKQKRIYENELKIQQQQKYDEQVKQYGISIYKLDNVYELINHLGEVTNYTPKDDNSKQATTISFFEGLFKVKLNSIIKNKEKEIFANGKNQFSERRLKQTLRDSLNAFKVKVLKDIRRKLLTSYNGKYSIDNLSIMVKISNNYDFKEKYYTFSVVIKTKEKKSFSPINQSIEWNGRDWRTGKHISNYRYDVFNPKVVIGFYKEFKGKLFINETDAEKLSLKLPLSINYNITDKLIPVELSTVGIQLGSVSSSQYNYIFWVDSELKIKYRQTTIFPLITNNIKRVLKNKNPTLEFGDVKIAWTVSSDRTY